jgi:hypothetical protein
MRHTRIKPLSDKRQEELKRYWKLHMDLIILCGNKSELSGDNPDWQTDYVVEPHHISGKEHEKLLDPFNILLLSREEHIKIQNHQPINGHIYTREELLNIVRPIRIKQGFKEAQDEQGK